MSGVAVIRWVLANSEEITAVIPAGRIMAGILPLSTVLPAISVSQISSVPYNLIRINESHKLYTDRVQITVLFKGGEGSPEGAGYPGLRALMKLIPWACRSLRGTINGVNVDSIVPQGEGPDFYNEETAVYACSCDYIVKYDGDAADQPYTLHPWGDMIPGVTPWGT